jgi:transaldolase
MSNPLQKLAEYGQSVWYDNVSRNLIKDGSFAKMIEEQAIVGVTSNPTIFEKAIGHTPDYDAQIKELVAQHKTAFEIYEALAMTDIGDVTDIFRKVYEKTNGLDGYVSLEVSPTLANDTEGTIKDGLRYFNALNRPNLMIKVPATPEGIPAVETLIGEGVNVNVTLIFSLEAYEQVAWAYVAGLEKLAASGKKPLNKVASVASFFVSRVDTLADKLLDQKIAATTNEAKKQELKALQGKLAIANSKLAYEIYQNVFGSERFAKLKAQGAHPQRVLWASTSTKNPAYRDVLYVEELIGKDTVNTMPPQTVIAFQDHGIVNETLTQDWEEARKVFADFEDNGISVGAVTAQLLDEGVKSFAKSFEDLINGVETKRQQLVAELGAVAS